MKYGFQLANDYDPKKHPTNAIAEVKYDGMMVLIENGRMYNRKGRDVTFQFPEVHVHPTVVIVGEIVILKDGISQFELLLKRRVDNPKEVRLRSMLYPATLVAFDLLELNGQNLTGEPLSKRRSALEALEHTGALNGHVFVAGYWGCPPEKVEEYLELMRQQNAEGIMVKDLNAPYAAARGDAWLKLKAWKERDYQVLSHEITENGGFVIWIENKGYRQKVVVNKVSLADDIAKGKVQQLTIRYLDEEPSGALRQPHVYRVPWDQ